MGWGPLKKLEFNLSDLEEFNIRHIDSKTKEPMNVNGAIELLELLNEKFERMKKLFIMMKICRIIPPTFPPPGKWWKN